MTRNEYGIPVFTSRRPPNFWAWFWAIVAALLLFVALARAEEIQLKASWYSIESLKREGTWKTSKGVMSNGRKFKDEEKTCATRIFKLGDYLRITNTRNGKSVDVKVTDRIGKRFADSRIDISRSAFEKIADLKEGLVLITVEVIHV